MVTPFLSLNLSHKIIQNHSGHPDPHGIVQVQLVKPVLCAPPLAHAMMDDLAPTSILVPLFVPSGTHQIDVGDVANTIVSVKLGDLLVQQLHVGDPVPVPRGRARGRVVLIPDKLGWHQERGHSKVIWSTWVILVIFLYYLLKLPESSHDSEPVPTLVQVIQASHHQDPHGCALPLVVNGPCLHQV